ncbi:unnamed protein product [Vitrella brassicaformis CCMP3155]|uniref:S-adenosylmethionine-dependent methyltransferase domain-containing protein n=1 Tax=Vitrella brassicaformis (strain CCMP3155) TaxID=1169540 RepID=A0A0G4F4F5_VITBC|nr:unnamed protein product [Vitrella brassicaformis CCMP3155]|eukprot:CEM06684.1 unnamed protein product [Vitrella brassicaformis CCMP3155]
MPPMPAAARRRRNLRVHSLPFQPVRGVAHLPHDAVDANPQGIPQREDGESPAGGTDEASALAYPSGPLPTLTDDPSTRPTLRIRPPEGSTHFDLSLANKLPWIYSNEVQNFEELRPLSPCIVNIFDSEGTGHGVGTYTIHSLIAGRVVSDNAYMPVDRAFLAGKIRRAMEMRRHLPLGRDRRAIQRDDHGPVFCRLVNGEGDDLPGLVIDRYGSICVVQHLTGGMERLRECIVGALVDVMGGDLTAVIHRNDSIRRRQERLALWKDMPYQKDGSSVSDVCETTVTIPEAGCSFQVDLMDSPSTGWFFDRRPVREEVAQLAKGKTVLDLFSYVGAFGVTAAARGEASKVTCVDSHAPYLQRGEWAAQSASVADRVLFQRANAFKYLQDAIDQRLQWDIVIADPPNWTPLIHQTALDRGEQLFFRLFNLAAKCVAPDGYLVALVSSRAFQYRHLMQILTEAIYQSDRKGVLVWEGQVSPDHPIHIGLPRSKELHTIIFRLTQ